jgi:hypothetical protein
MMAAVTMAGPTTVVRVTYSNGASYSWDPFGSNYTDGASVALGDLTGNGIPDIVVASGATGTSMPGTVQVYDGSTRKLIATYTPLGSFGGGLEVAVGDVTGSGHGDIIVGVMSGGWPVVDVLDGETGQQIDQFLAYSTSFAGGVRLGSGDVNGDGYADVVVGPGVGAHGLPVEVYSGASIKTGTGTPALLGTMNPFPQYTGVLFIAVGELNAGGDADIVVSTSGSGGQFAAYSGESFGSSSQPAPMFTQTAQAVGNNSGIRVALVPDSSENGRDDLIVTNGTGTQTARYLDSNMTTTGWSASDAELFTPLPGLVTPIYVG